MHDEVLPFTDVSIRDGWADRLVDGSYLQRRGSLVEGWVGNPPEAGEHAGHAQQACCLGVLSGLAIERQVDGVRWRIDEGKTFVQVWDEEQASYHPDDDEAGWVDWTDEDLPPVVAKWAFGDSECSNPVLGDSSDFGAVAKAIELNDEAMATFTEIAEYVRAMPVKEGDGAQA